MVKGNTTPDRRRQCAFSDEPMICIYGEFGVRLEDLHLHDRGWGALVHDARRVRWDDPFRLRRKA